MRISDGPDAGGTGARPFGTRAAAVAVALLLVGHAVLAWLSRPAGIRIRGDDAHYLLLSEALRHFQYVDYWQLGWPAHRVYPPGYPLLLALWRPVAGSSFDAQVVLGIALSTLALLAAYLLVARHLDRRVALAALAALAFNTALIIRAGSIASELPYALVSVLALLVYLERPTGRGLLLACALAVFAGLTRSVGGALLGALVVMLMVRRRYAAAAGLALAAGLTWGLWLLWGATSPDRVADLSYVGLGLRTPASAPGPGAVVTLLTRAARNAAGYARALVYVVLPFPDLLPSRLDTVAWLGVGTAGLVAGAAAVPRAWRVVPLYLALYAAVLLSWPWAVPRLLEPLAPLLVPLCLYGLWWAARRLVPRARYAVLVGAAAIMTASAAWQSTRELVERFQCGREPLPGPNRCLDDAQRDWLAAVRWVRDSTPAQAAVLTSKPASFFYFARHATTSFEAALARPPAGWADHLRRSGATYIVLTTLMDRDRERLAPLLASACRDLAVAAEFNPQAYVLRLRTGQPADSADACAAVAEYQRLVADSAAGKRWR